MVGLGRSVGVLAVAAAAAGIPSAGSASFIGLTDARRIGASCSGDPIPFPPCAGSVGGATVTPSAPFAFFDQSVSFGGFFASQTSSFSSSLLEGSGRIEGFGDAGDIGGAISTYSITFDVDVATPFSLSGVLETLFWAGGTIPSISLTELTQGTEVFGAFASDRGGPTPFDASGVLAPGPYRVLVSANFGGFLTNSSAAFQFELLAIPEPSTALLLAAGLAGFAARSR